MLGHGLDSGRSGHFDVTESYMPRSKKQPRMTPAEQSEAFIKLARELGTDESPQSFARVVKRVAPKRPTAAARKR
jgi:hypothetical protein